MSASKKGVAMVIGDEEKKPQLPASLAAKVQQMPTPEEKIAKAQAREEAAAERKGAMLDEKKRSLSTEFEKVKEAQERAKEARARGDLTQDNEPKE